MGAAKAFEDLSAQTVAEHDRVVFPVGDRVDVSLD
jgi:hypothetical protein